MEKIYVNENFPLPVVITLRSFGYDVLTSLEAGNANLRIPDDEVLVFAREEKRIVLTLNRRDFIRLHFANPTHAGVIVCTTDNNFSALSERIHHLLTENSGNFENMLFRVNKE
jgi:predicted nuclease of predicted toxin-antitoxin system